jgi:hypothetical protein
MKILNLVGPYNTSTPVISETVSSLGPVTNYHYRVDYGMSKEHPWFWGWQILDGHYKQSDPDLLRVYDKIRSLAKDHDVIYHAVGDMMHPEFIKTLSKTQFGDKYTIYCVDGEPASSAMLSHPVVWAYDFALTCSKYYDERRKAPSMLSASGAYGASWVCCGTKYPDNHWAWDIPIDGERDIDVIFLGANMAYQTGQDPYPPNKYRAVEFLRSKGLKVYCEEWTGIEMAAELYKRAKVGICLHGPSQYGVGNSQRLYDLTVCGVPVVTDGATLGIEEIFNSDEVSSYLWSNFEEMYHKVSWLLENKESRQQMATKARERTRKYYNNGWMERGIKIAIDYWKQKGIWNENLK